MKHTDVNFVIGILLYIVAVGCGFLMGTSHGYWRAIKQFKENSHGR